MNKGDLWKLGKWFGNTPSNQPNTQQNNPGALSLPSESPKPSQPNVAPTGWRAWRAELEADGYVLYSPTYRYRWDGPTVRGEGPTSNHYGIGMLAGVSDPAYGFHAGAQREQADPYIGNAAESRFESTAFEPRLLTQTFGVLGEVECHGKIVEHTQGWRAQAMTVRRLIVFVNDTQLRADLERRYQCDVTVEASPPPFEPWYSQPLMQAAWTKTLLGQWWPQSAPPSVL